MYFETHSVAFLDIPVFRKILQEPEPVSIALRVDNFKVIYNFHKKSWEMYNLDEDPEEQHNLFDSDEPQWRLLASKLWEWYRKRDTFEADQIQIELDIDTDESSSF
jgi:arylsulfatase A-like enzyme